MSVITAFIVGAIAGAVAGLLAGTYLWDRFSEARADAVRRYEACTKELERHMQEYRHAQKEQEKMRAEFIRAFASLANKGDN